MGMRSLSKFWTCCQFRALKGSWSWLDLIWFVLQHTQVSPPQVHCRTAVGKTINSNLHPDGKGELESINRIYCWGESVTREVGGIGLTFEQCASRFTGHGVMAMLRRNGNQANQQSCPCWLASKQWFSQKTLGVMSRPTLVQEAQCDIRARRYVEKIQP